VEIPGTYQVQLSTDDPAFGGSGLSASAPIKSEQVACGNFEESIVLNLPPFSGMILKCVRKKPVRKAKAPGKGADTAAEKAVKPARKKAEPKKAIKKPAASKRGVKRTKTNVE
jgi:hypothetical protein